MDGGHWEKIKLSLNIYNNLEIKLYKETRGSVMQVNNFAGPSPDIYTPSELK